MKILTAARTCGCLEPRNLHIRKELFISISHSDEAIFAEVVRYYYRLLLPVTELLVYSRETARDIVQEVIYYGLDEAGRTGSDCDMELCWRNPANSCLSHYYPSFSKITSYQIFVTQGNVITYRIIDIVGRQINTGILIGDSINLKKLI